MNVSSIPESLGDHVDRLYRAAWGLCGSREDAEDLVQETFAKVLSKRRLVRSDDDLGYLLRCAAQRPHQYLSHADAPAARSGDAR